MDRTDNSSDLPPKLRRAQEELLRHLSAKVLDPPAAVLALQDFLELLDAVPGAKEERTRRATLVSTRCGPESNFAHHMDEALDALKALTVPPQDPGLAERFRVLSMLKQVSPDEKGNPLPWTNYPSLSQPVVQIHDALDWIIDSDAVGEGERVFRTWKQECALVIREVKRTNADGWHLIDGVAEAEGIDPSDAAKWRATFFRSGRGVVGGGPFSPAIIPPMVAAVKNVDELVASVATTDTQEQPTPPEEPSQPGGADAGQDAMAAIPAPPSSLAELPGWIQAARELLRGQEDQALGEIGRLVRKGFREHLERLCPGEWHEWHLTLNPQKFETIGELVAMMAWVQDQVAAAMAEAAEQRKRRPLGFAPSATAKKAEAGEGEDEPARHSETERGTGALIGEEERKSAPVPLSPLSRS